MASGPKIDLFRELKAEYASPKKPKLIRTTRGSYLAIAGQGSPGGEEYVAKIGAIYSMAYTIKMTRKFDGEQDYTVCKLEALTWADGEEDLSKVPMDLWQWQLLIRTPAFVKNIDLHSAVKKLKERGKEEFARDVGLIFLSEGRCIQMLHVGPYEKEGETVAQMKEFAEASGWGPRGKHHEIFLSDPRRVPPERLETILRMRVQG